MAVQIVQRWIVAALRHRTFFSLSELNEAIRERLVLLNARPFKKLPGCRASAFAEMGDSVPGLTFQHPKSQNR